jgi:lysophospholipase L1-like esterase
LSKRVRILGWALIFTTPLLFLLGVEGVVRILGVSPAFERDAALPAWLDRNILVKDAVWMESLSEGSRDLHDYYGTYEWDRHLFYRYRPGVTVPLTDATAPPGIRPRTRWVLRTNSRGYPGPDVEPGPHPATYRIVCMGDSSTFGWGVNTEDTYPVLLQAELSRRHPGTRIEVVNLGVCGYSSFQGRILLEREGLKYEPDLVTLSYGSNDWSRVPEPFDVAYRRNAGWSGAVRSLLQRSRAYQIYAAFLTRTFSGSWSERVTTAGAGMEEMPLNVGPEKSEENLRHMIREVRRSGADPILVTNCVKDRMAAPIRAAAAAEGAPLINTGDLLREAIPSVAREGRMVEHRARVLATYGAALVAEHPGLEVYLSDGCHPNVVGQRLLAEALARAVEASPSFRLAVER